MPPFDELLGERLVAVLDFAAAHVPVDVVATALAEVRRYAADVCVSVGGGSAIGLGQGNRSRDRIAVGGCPHDVFRVGDDLDLGSH